MLGKYVLGKWCVAPMAAYLVYREICLSRM